MTPHRLAIAALVLAVGGVALGDEPKRAPCYAKSVKLCSARLESKQKKLGTAGLRRALESRCDYDVDAEACVMLAIVRHRGIDGDVDEAGSQLAAWQACEIDRAACKRVGRALYTGRGLGKHKALGRELMREAKRVARGEVFTPPAEATVTLQGTKPSESVGGELRGDRYIQLNGRDSLALEAYIAECDAGRADACAKAGTMCARGRGTRGKRPERAAYYLGLACELDRSTCMDISQGYADGGALAKDKALAKKFRKLAMRREAEPGCRYGNADKCVSYGHAYMNGTFVGKDEDYATVLFREACDAGSGDGCVSLAERYLDTEQRQRDAAELFDKACSAKSAAGCWKLGRLYLRGEHVAQDTKRAEKLFSRACELGDQAGCKYVERKP